MRLGRSNGSPIASTSVVERVSLTDPLESRIVGSRFGGQDRRREGLPGRPVDDDGDLAEFGGIDQADTVQDARLLAEDHGRRHVTFGVGRDDHRDVERHAEDALTPLGDDGPRQVRAPRLADEQEPLVADDRVDELEDEGDYGVAAVDGRIRRARPEARQVDVEAPIARTPLEHGCDGREQAPMVDPEAMQEQDGRPLTDLVRSRRAGRRRAASRRSRRPLSRDEPPDPLQRLLEPLVRGRVAHPDVPGARRAEGAAGHDRDPLLGQQPLGEGLVIEPGRADPREGVEGAARLEGVEPERVEPVDQQASAAVVLGRPSA